MRLYHLLILVAYCSLLFAALTFTARFAEDSMFYTWLLTIDAVGLPWVALALVRLVFRPGPLRDSAARVLWWLPIGLIFAMLYFWKKLALDPEHGLALPLWFCFLFIPTAAFLAARQARSNRSGEP
jgi:hypothetical protein